MKSRKTPPSATNTRKSAPNVLAQPLRARIRLALDVSRVPKSGFVERQIAIHREYQSHEQQQLAVADRFQRALTALETIAAANEWSQRRMAGKCQIPETTLRRIKRGKVVPEFWLAKLETAVTRLQRA